MLSTSVPKINHHLANNEAEMILTVDLDVHVCAWNIMTSAR